MNDKKIHLMSFGCQMNKLDSTLVGSALKDAGFGFTDSIKDADVVLINTCSVREHAEQRVISNLGHLKHIKESRPDVVVGVIGCMAQRLGNKLLEHEAVNIVCGPAQIPKIAELVTDALAQKKKAIAVGRSLSDHNRISGLKPTLQNEIQNQSLEEFETVFSREEEKIPGQAFVRVMRGCNNFCSYCIVPYVRGPEVCRQPRHILEQIKRLADGGVKQVTLLGQTVNSYKYEQDEKIWCLADLLEAAGGIEGIEWLKFVTSYPSEEFFDEILQVMADTPKVCRYLHMPAQSGSDKILKAMNRHYSRQSYLELLARARAIVPDIAVAGDFIVGFPSETEEDFQESVDLMQKAGYRNAFIFKYSTRPGTTADKRLEDTVPAEIKQKRNIELLAVQEKISDRLSRDFLGRKMKVLVEGLSKKTHRNPGENANPQLVGRTAEDWIVVFNGPKSLAGSFAQVKITDTSPQTLFGRLI